MDIIKSNAVPIEHGKQMALIDFFKHFEVRLARTEQEIAGVLKLRHDVFCEELGYEAVNDAGIETDSFDNHSVHFYVRHKRTGVMAGSMRIVSPRGVSEKLPIERFSGMITHEDLSPKSYSRLTLAEISRAVVPEAFRKRTTLENEANAGNNPKFNQDEAKSFPNIAIAMYLTAMAVLLDSRRTNTFIIMEPRLARGVRMIGINCEAVGDTFDFRGVRAPYYVDINRLTNTLKPDYLKFFKMIETSLSIDKRETSKDDDKAMEFA